MYYTSINLETNTAIMSSTQSEIATFLSIPVIKVSRLLKNTTYYRCDNYIIICQNIINKQNKGNNDNIKKFNAITKAVREVYKNQKETNNDY